MIKVSVVMTAYNYGKFIGRALESILNQSLNRSLYEIIVVDDGSTDNTQEILKEFRKDIILITQKNKGLVASCNIAIKQAHGKYIMRLDADDEVDGDILLFESRILDTNSEIGFVYTDRIEVDVSDGRNKRINMETFDLFKMIACGIMFRKSYIEDIGLYDNLYFEEYDLLLRYLSKYKGYYLKLPLYTYYLHGNNMVLKKEARERGWEELIRKWGIEELKKWGYRDELRYNC